MKITVYGRPAQQGSSKAFIVRDRRTHKPRAIVTSDNRTELQAWREAVRTEAQTEAIDRAGYRDTGAVGLRITWRLPRPARAKAGDLPATRPDIDKLERAILDALTGTWYRDDGQVTDVEKRKRYAEPGAPPSVEIEMTDPEPE
jgi:crossover junction endodeoxyribonuclease RusA